MIREQKRARQLGIKSIYLFCDENQKESTQLQKEIIETYQEKFHVIHEFSDFMSAGYQSVLHDITNIYRNYCKGYLIDKEDGVDREDLKFSSINIYTVDKHLFKGFDLTKHTLLKCINLFGKDLEETSELDKVCSNLLDVIIGNNSKDLLNFNLMEKELCKIHDEFLIKVIKIRFKAIKAYFNNSIDECLSLIKLAYKESNSNTSIPNWLSNDVLIDMRNIRNLLDETKSQYTIENKAQVLLNKNKESVYYPVLDRYDTGFYKKVLNKYLSSNIQSPYTTSFGGVEIVFEKIASIFVIAFIYGSLTHILTTPERIIDALSSFCLVYNNHRMYIELLKLLVIFQKDKEIEKISRAYNQTTDMINSDDIHIISNPINSIPIKHKRIISKLILFKHFGYYFSDKQFLTISNEIFNEINDWINDSNRVFALSNYIFKALKSNVRRLDNNKISNVLISIFNKGLKRWYDDALKVIQSLDFKSLAGESVKRLIEILLKLIKEEETRKNCHYLSQTIIYVRKNTRLTEDIDKCVKTHMKDFFHKNYELEVFSLDEDFSLKHIDRFVKKIQTQNKEQGQNGKYYGWGGNPYQTIRNIIEYNKLDLKWDSIVPIINAIEETVICENQTISAKINSIQLLLYLNNNTKYKQELKKTFDKWMNMRGDILCGHEDGVFCKDTVETLKFNILMLEVCFGKEDVNELISYFSLFTRQNNYEIIKSLECVEVLLHNIDFNSLDKITLIILTQYIIGMSSHKETDVRYYSVRLLFLLCGSSCRDSAMIQISKMMDNDNYLIKANILNRIDVLMENNIEIAKIVKQKGQVDNHYLVRCIVENLNINEK